MAKGRDMAAESIADFLETARAHQHSGLLKAEYAQGGRSEEGELYILAGQPIYARVGKVTGHEALSRLLSWRNILFSFATDMPRPPANISASLRITGAINAVQAPAPAPPLSSSVGRPQSMRNDRQPMLPPPRNRYKLLADAAIPRKVGIELDVNALGLSRRQRLVYFLVDGQRSVSDLARTTSKAVSEVEMILHELQDMRLVIV